MCRPSRPSTLREAPRDEVDLWWHEEKPLILRKRAALSRRTHYHYPARRGRNDARNTTAAPDPGPRDCRHAPMGNAGRGDRRGAALTLCAIRRAGIPPPGAE